MKRYYLGAFPPGYGGVTIKNDNLYHALCGKIEIEKIDFNRIKRKNIIVALQFIYAMLHRNSQYVIGVSGKKTRRLLTMLLSIVNKNAMRRSVIMIMGGKAAGDIATDANYRMWASNYRKIYVETEGMLHQLIDAGMTNGALYPNGRFKPRTELMVHADSTQQLRCIYFSQVSQEKGVGIVLDAAKKLPDVQFDIYGKVVEKYEEVFFEYVKGIPNVSYCGIYREKGDQLYGLLNTYDIMLFPTKCAFEGVPGTLIEAKIAGLASVVSDISYNAELVADGNEGIVLSENNVEQLAQAIRHLEQDRQYLLSLKRGSKASAERYYIENYINEILEELS